VVLAAALAGCGVVVGGAIDRGNDLLMFPFRKGLFFGAYEYANPSEEGWRVLPARHDMGDVTLGIAISGGGSRSAYFAACVLEALGHEKIPGTSKTFLDEVDYISAVSGGSLTAAYYCANRHRKGFPEDNAAFFARMKEDLSRDFELESAWRFLAGSFALVEFTYYDTWNIFSALWDSDFLDDQTFGDLDPSGPILIVNATSYDTGEKFVFSRAPLEKRSLPRIEELLGSRVGMWTGSAKLGATMTFETLDSNIGRCPLSTAIAASAAVPGILGPVVLRDRKTKTDVHLGDGGIYDNHGLESLLLAMLPEVNAHPERPAIILVIDGAGFFESGEKAGSLTTLAEFMDRVTAISWVRSAGYEAIALRFAQEEAIRRGEGYPFRHIVAETISLYDAEGLSKAVSDPTKLTSVMSALKAVPTRFSISPEAAAAIRESAAPLTNAAMGRLERDMIERRRRLAEPTSPPAGVPSSGSR
jgi:predicted acylesterase/phospholipase RssA